LVGHHLSSSPRCGQKQTVAGSGRSSHASVPKGHEISEKLAKTSWLDGSFEGFQCPRDGCKGIGIRRDLEED
jgi:hypothetical protein